MSPLKEEVIKAQSEIGSNGRVLLRASGTEPILRIMVEAKDQKDVDFWTSYIAKLVKQHLATA